MTGYLVKWYPGGNYLEYVPYDRSFAFCAGLSEYATVFTREAAETLRQRYPDRDVQVIPVDRTPQFDVDTLPVPRRQESAA